MCSNHRPINLFICYLRVKKQFKEKYSCPTMASSRHAPLAPHAADAPAVTRPESNLREGKDPTMRTRSPFGIALLVLTVAFTASCTPPPESQEYARFRDSEFRVEFDYPASMVPQVTRDARVERGVNLSSITARFVDRREVATIYFQAIDDPTLALSPGWYPPSEAQLRIFAAMDLGNLALDKSADNKSAVDAALDSGSLKTISSYPALTYRVFLDDSSLGYIYIRGAIIVTQARTYTLMVIGGLSAESPIHQPVKPERVDEIWSHILSTITLER